MENTTIIPIERLLKVSEVAEMLAVSESYIYRIIQRGEIASVTMGRSKRLKAAAVEDFINAHSIPISSPNVDYNGN